MVKKAYSLKILVATNDEKTTESGLVLKEETKQVTSGKVISVGEGIDDLTNAVVYFLRSNAIPIEKGLYVLEEKDILLVERAE